MMAANMAASCCLRKASNALRYPLRGLVITSFHSTPVNEAGQEWRKAHGLPACPNSYGPLTDGPDWSYADGRPAPLRIAQKRRILEQMQYAKRIVELVKEVDFAVERHAKLQQEKKEETEAILANKLKPKGHRLLLKDGSKKIVADK